MLGPISATNPAQGMVLKQFTFWRWRGVALKVRGQRMIRGTARPAQHADQSSGYMTWGGTVHLWLCAVCLSAAPVGGRTGRLCPPSLGCPIGIAWVYLDLLMEEQVKACQMKFGLDHGKLSEDFQTCERLVPHQTSQ